MIDEDPDTPDGPTRRDYLRYGGFVAGGALLAGCTDDGGSGSTPEPTGTDPGTPTPRDSATATGTATGTDASTETSGSGSYTVSMAPMGEVAFESAPETVFTRLTHLAGMAFALGRGNDVNAMHAPDYYDGVWNQFTPRLPGVSLDWSGLYSSWETSKETLYELDSDVHLADPASVCALDGWDESDVEEITENVGPWFGNSLSARHQEPPAAWADRYEFYGLWEIFERVARAFRETERYEVLAEIHAGMLDAIEGGLPPAEERPTAVMALPRDLDNIYVYKVNNPGFLTAHTRPFETVEAFGEDVSSGDAVDMEAMLEADPDVMLGMGGMSPGTDMAEARAALEDHPVGSQLSAVQDGRVYAQAARYQGPVLNLFQLEMTAKQLYPERFGEWPTYTGGPYPEIPEAERLFDRQQVADAINGAI